MMQLSVFYCKIANARLNFNGTTYTVTQQEDCQLNSSNICNDGANYTHWLLQMLQLMNVCYS